MKQYDIAVVIGRFSPPHFAHIELFKRALDVANDITIVIGSYNSPRSIRTPWTAEERAEMILSCFSLEEQKHIHFGFVSDTLYNDPDWVADVSATVRGVERKLNLSFDYPPKIALIGHEKDDTGYVNYFKSWKFIDVGNKIVGDAENSMISATKVRELYFEKYFNFLPSICPPSVVTFLTAFAKTTQYAELQAEYDAAIKYDAQYENAPYGQVNFVTVDNIVIQSGHILLIKRKDAPGKGLWALPGGHLNVNETFLQGALRELKEETNIKVPEKVLRGSIFFDQVFDHPDRSLRCRTKSKKGRTITRAFGFKLDDSSELAHVKGGDDADTAWWFTFDEIQNMRNVMFEDHYDLTIKALNSL
jgi:bifunctional NMN adenylyltransferase/nudix hydrolase